MCSDQTVQFLRSKILVGRMLVQPTF